MDLNLRGNADLLDSDRVRIAIIGARAATNYGAHVASDLGATLSESGHVVVSGLAYGIDAAAHRGALAAGGDTIAVLPSGLDRIYPVAHENLAQQVASAGLLASPFDATSAPTKQHFHHRNDIILDLVDAVVIVEGTNRSGSSSVAVKAEQRGVPIFAVPGPITSAASELPNRLLRERKAFAIDKINESSELITAVIDSESRPSR